METLKEAPNYVINWKDSDKKSLNERMNYLRLLRNFVTDLENLGDEKVKSNRGGGVPFTETGITAPLGSLPSNAFKNASRSMDPCNPNLAAPCPHQEKRSLYSSDLR